MSLMIDESLTRWGEKLFRLSFRNRGRSAPRTDSGKSLSNFSHSADFVRSQIDRTSRRTPEVMVKLPKGRGVHTVGGVSRQVHYLARTDADAEQAEKPPVTVEDHEGNFYRGKDEINDLIERFANGKSPFPKTAGKKTPKQSFHIVLSMPPGTNRAGVHDAARAFAKTHFSNHEYILVNHEDEKHPHVHLCVKAKGRDGKRLNPRKGILQEWRESFAEKLRDRGIDANATPRSARGVTQKGQQQTIRHIDKEYVEGRRAVLSKTTQGQNAALKIAGETGSLPQNPAAEKIEARRKEVMKTYKEISEVLVKSRNPEDWKLAVQLVDYLKSMFPVKTRLEAQYDAVYGVSTNKPASATKTTRLRSDAERER